MVAGLVALSLTQRPLSQRALDRLAADLTAQAARELDSNQPEDAESSCRRALEALDKLLDSQPKNRDYRRERANALELMAQALVAQNRPDEAAATYREAVPVWADLVAEGPSAVDDRQRMAACLDRYGVLLVEIGRWDDADYVFSRGRSLCEIVPDVIKHDPRVRRDLILFLSRLARLTLDMGRRSDSLEIFAKAVSAQRALADRFSENPEERERLIGILLDQAEAQTAFNQRAEAERSLAEAGEIAMRIAAGDGNSGDARHQGLWARTIYRLATVIQFDPRRTSEARQHFERAMAIQEKLVDRKESGRDDLADLATTCGSLANLLCTQELYAKAEALYRKELACQTALVHKHPGDVAARFAHGRVLHNLADFLRERGRTKEALPLEREAVSELASVYKKEFRNPEYRTALSYACWTLCALELDLKDHRAAALAIEQYQQIEAAGFEEPLESARFFCRSMKLCESDTSLPEPTRATLARSYADRAIRALETAVRNGYNDRRDLESAPSYEPLRGRDDFARLVREVEARSKIADKD